MSEIVLAKEFFRYINVKETHFCRALDVEVRVVVGWSVNNRNSVYV